MLCWLLQVHGWLVGELNAALQHKAHLDGAPEEVVARVAIADGPGASAAAKVRGPACTCRACETLH